MITPPPAAGRRAGRLPAVLLGALLLVGYLTPLAPASAEAFDPGNIIADSVFHNSASMTAGQIDAFLAERAPACRPAADGTPCLKDYRETTWTRTSTVCSGTYAGGANETAGTILAKIATACRINPQVLLVTLQKEQGLVTASGSQLTPRRYQIAMGFGCPDTAPCDSQYYGFYNQVYSAAQQFQRYAQNPSRYAYRAGLQNRVGFHPTSSCGSSIFLISNQATASLYNYTPYQPNTALLQGRPDSCSSYGNHNFWRFFTTWFGSPQQAYSVVGGFAALWNALGGVNSPIGVPTTNQQSGIPGGGSYQIFAGGAIYSSPTSGMHYLTSAFRSPWQTLGSERGVLGYPVTDPIGGLRNGGSFQNFQGGSIHSSPAYGAVPTYGAIRALWVRSGFEEGPLGYPRFVQGNGLPAGGSYQVFERGSVYSSSLGTYQVLPPILAAWGAVGYERGTLGYPVANAVSGIRTGGSFQHFQGGSVYTSALGSFAVPNAVRLAWAARAAEAGPLGYPMSAARTMSDGGTLQHFEGGSIFSSPRGTFVVEPSTLGAYSRQGRESGSLGYPTSNLNRGLLGGGTYQDFVGGSIYVTPGRGSFVVARTIHSAWGAYSWERGSLGYPVTDTGTIRSGGVYQHFENGSLYSSPSTGARVVTPEFLAAWSRTGWEAGPLGYPVSNRNTGLVGGGSYQDFEGGAVYSSPSTGTFTVGRQIWNAWSWTGWERGAFGFPIGEQQEGAGVVFQQFQGGTIYVRIT